MKGTDVVAGSNFDGCSREGVREKERERESEKSLRLADKIYESGIKGDASSE